jgi:hypothetical protein
VSQSRTVITVDCILSMNSQMSRNLSTSSAER